MKTRDYALLTLALAAGAWLYCSDSSTGGNGSDTPNAAVGALHNEDGSMAVGATVRFYPVGADPRTAAAAATVTTDDGGRYAAASLAAGAYNVLGLKDNARSFLDSVAVAGSDTTQLPDDTLRAAGSVCGVVKLVGDTSADVYLLALGTGVFATPDSAGGFCLSDMAGGAYHIRILTTLTGYGPRDTVLTVVAGQSGTLGDTLWVNSGVIPVPRGVALQYDTVWQAVTLRWEACDSSAIAGYHVYRKDPGAGFARIGGAMVVATEFSDSTLADDGTYEYLVRAVDRSANESGGSSRVAVQYQSRYRLATDAPAFGLRRDHSSVVFDSAIWVIGGTSSAGQYTSEVWRSSDGASWSLVTPSAAFPARKLHGSALLNGRMWLTGGLTSSGGVGGYMRDVWYSLNGTDWSSATDSAGFSPRCGHGCAAWQGKIWVVAGVGPGGQPLADVWSSADGVVWQQVTPSAGFPPREGASLVVYRDELWLSGGTNVGTDRADVWRSLDGAQWTEVTATASFPGRYYHGTVARDTVLWLVGGMGTYLSQFTVFADAWYSADGSQWARMTPPSSYLGKRGHTMCVFNGRIWLVGQVGEESRSDVWYIR